MIRFLRSFLTLFGGSTRTNPRNQENSATVATSEVITRFVMSSSHYRKSDGTVKHQAFLPELHPQNNILETSVFRISRLTEAEIWDLGVKEVSRGKRAFHCRADLEVQEIEQVWPLSVIPEKTTHPLHAIIINWPPSKDEQKLLALQLEQIAKVTQAL